MRRSALLTLSIGTALLASCNFNEDDAGDTVGNTIVRDSVVGADSTPVRVIESTAAATEDLIAPFTVDTQATLVIGTDDGEEPYLLHRVYDAMRLDDGRILVGNSGSHEIRVYSASGEYQRSVGRRGSGPGEFSEYSSIQFHQWADSVLATDDMRVHVYTLALDSAITRPYDVTSGASRPFTRGVFANGNRLIMAADGGGTLGGAPGSIINMNFQLMSYSANGSFSRSLLSYAGAPRYVHSTAGSTSYPYVPLASDVLQGVVGDSLLVLRGGKPQLEWYDQQGRLVQIARWARTQVAARDVFAEYVDSSLAGMRRGSDREQEARYTAFYKLDLPLPQFAPQYIALKVDDAHRVWLERFRMPGDTGPRRWDVIDVNGEWIGTVALPPRFTLFRAGRDYVLGRTLDSMGVERVQLHEIRDRGTP